MTQVITNKDGRMETVKDGPKITPEDLARQRRALRDMLDGNTQFHEDPQVEKKDEPGLYLDSGEFVPASQVNRGWQ